MAFVLHTVASILRGSDKSKDNSIDCCCHKHPNRCCHTPDYALMSRSSFALSTLKYVNARTSGARDAGARASTSAD